MDNPVLPQEYNEKIAPLVREIGWTHNLLILYRCKDDLQREFYIRMTRKFGWSKNVLIHQIENQSYEKTLLGQTNFDKALPEALRNQAKLPVKDEYTLCTIFSARQKTASSWNMRSRIRGSQSVWANTGS
jgi:hypothetical protein